MWGHVSKWRVAQRNHLCIPPQRTVQDRSVLERSDRQMGGKDLWERCVNANERWQSTARTLHRLLWGRLGSVGRALAGFPPSIVRPSAFSSRPPPTSNNRPPSRTLTERSSAVPPKTLENVGICWHVKNYPRLTAFSDFFAVFMVVINICQMCCPTPLYFWYIFYVLTNLFYYLYIYTKEFSWIYSVNWNNINANILIYCIMFA